MNILLVDDDPDMRFLITFLLEQQVSAQITTAESLAEAKAHLDAGVYDLLILDYLLPDGEGAELLEHNQLKSETTPVPVVILTAKSDPDLREQLLNAGANAVLHKPINPAVLIEGLEPYLTQTD